MSYCYSCAMPLTPDAKSPSKEYCKYCADDKGHLKSSDEIKNGIAHWFTQWQGVDMPQALKRAEHYMRSMPAWAASL